MSATCPKCFKVFRGRTIGQHARKCGVTMEDCFWAKVNKTEGCWLWTASRKERGYGQFLWQGKMHRAHRLAWVLSGRELPGKGLELAHSCHNKLCVNPEHLRPATHLENMRESKAMGLHAHGERSFNAILTEDMVRQIRLDYRCDGRRSNADEIAARLGVSKSTVYHAAVGNTWTHIK